MKYQNLGKTDISVSKITLGCWAFAGGDLWGTQEANNSLATVHAALDMGINFFDTAEGYTGDDYSENVLGQALVGRRQETVIATKVSPRNLSKADIQQACERSLRRLQTDYIDLYQIHWANPDIPIEETMEGLARLKEQGKIRAVGVSNFGVLDLSDILELGRCETNQLPYNLLWRAIEYDIIPKCEAEGVGVLCYSVLQQGLLTGKYATIDDLPPSRTRSRHFSGDRAMSRHGQPGYEPELIEAFNKVKTIAANLEQPMANVSLAWALHQPGITSVIAGARTPAQIQETAQSVDLALSPETLTSLNEATAELKEALGPNPDMWQAQGASRYR